MKKRLAVYAGTFDPPTLGHLWVIEQAAEVFKKLIVAVGTNPQKQCMFSVEERLEMLKESTAHLANIRIDSYPNRYLVHYAKSVGARFIVRGIRSEKDYKYESELGDFNNKICPSITTIFMMPPLGIADISSSRVKELTGPEGWEDVMQNYVPMPVLKKLKESQLLNLLKQQWLALCQDIGAKGDALKILDDLILRYREPHRHYHTLSHIQHWLAELKESRHLACNVNAVKIAGWFHDAKSTEEESAELAATILRNAGLSEEFISLVVKIILATKHINIEPPTDIDAKLGADIDLSSFGLPEKDFDNNGIKIWEEYKHYVPENVFKAERAKILNLFLKREKIYYTQFFFEKYEAQARQNLTRALAQLSK